MVEVVLCRSSDTLSTWASSWWPSYALLVFRVVPSAWTMAENGDHRNVISAPRQRQGSAEHNLRTNSCCHNTSLATLELVMCCHVSKCFHPWLFDGAVEAAWLTWFKVTVLRPVEKKDTSRSPVNVWSWHSIQRVIQCVIQTAEGVQQNMEEDAGNYVHSGLHRPKSVAFCW